jgi:hypothetical protein
VAGSPGTIGGDLDPDGALESMPTDFSPELAALAKRLADAKEFL